MLWFLHLLNAAVYASVATSAALDSRQIQWPPLPNNLTADVLQVAFAISPPCAANNTMCQQLTTVVIPRCERLRGDPGCWCGNHDPVHYCAICMSSPADNQTTPDQTQSATAGHAAFHVACNAYEELINGTASTTSTSSMFSTTSQTPTATAVSSNSGENKTPVGAIVGGVVGGVVGLAFVVGIIYLLAIVLKKPDRRSDDPSNFSYRSSEHKSPNLYANPYPQLSAPYPGPAPGHVSPHNSTYVPGPEPMNPMPISQSQPPVQPTQN
ncbi:unnamed protein product [Rhizoctonia solani]|uniref:Mid2 domain-containing protein n=1 Tax=Rhizoctonia solani TaxID=456999 RepID=A0A8H3CBJ5_9AGAM|nr:unnamed protein product [Rhizoctonia solani]